MGGLVSVQKSHNIGGVLLPGNRVNPASCFLSDRGVLYHAKHPSPEMTFM